MNKKPSITQHGSDIMSSTSLYYTTTLPSDISVKLMTALLSLYSR